MGKSNKSKLKTEIVYSKRFDKLVKSDIDKSTIWGDCTHPDDFNVKGDALSGWWKYTIKFDGATPVQCIKAEKLR